MRHSLVLALAGLLLLVPAVDAKEFQDVSGQYQVIFPEMPTFDQKSPNQCVINVRFLFAMTGDLNGVADLQVTANYKGSCFDNSVPATVHGKGSFEGSLGDANGAFDLSVAFKHDNWVASGQMTIQHATGDLAGLHGILYIDGTVGLGGDYHGTVHFAP